MKLTQKEFDSLMKKITPEEESLHGTIAFGIQLQNYSIGFYGEAKDSFELIVDEFSRKHRNEWVKCTPTEYQRLVMQAKLIDKRKQLEEQEVFENQEVPNDDYSALGVKPSDFY